MSKPTVSIWNKTLIIATALLLGLFPIQTRFSQSASALGTPAPTPTNLTTYSPIPSTTPSPVISPSQSAFNPELYSVDDPASLWVIVDKKRPLNPINFVPKNLVKPRFDDGAGTNPFGIQLAKPAAKAIKLLATAMKISGAGTLSLASTYRSYSTQVAVHSKDVAALGLVAGENLAARPGFSEHQTGLAADLSAVGQGCTVRVCFAQTKAGKWLSANAWQFGWILRYPDGRTATTGYQFEPWHYRYVGLELSTEMHSTGIRVLEDFFHLPAAPSY